ncbi:MAG: sulfurtransferase, partial [Burkholderiaceae bacterium]
MRYEFKGVRMRYTTLISTAELAQHLADPDWVILDCRHDLANPQAGEEAYAAGHIPHAQLAHLDRDLSDKSPGPNGEFRGRHPLPSREVFLETLRDWGVNADSQVVAYDAQGGMFAGRLGGMLRSRGHERGAVVGGGLP